MSFQSTYTDCKFVKLPIPGDKVPDKLWLGSPLMSQNHLINNDQFTQQILNLSDEIH